MDEDTRLSRIEEAVSKLQKLVEQQNQVLMESLHSLNIKHDALVNRLNSPAQNNSKNASSGNAVTKFSVSSSSTNQNSAIAGIWRNIKLEIPKFCGENSLEWIFKVERILNSYEVAEENRITMVAFAFEGPALKWYQWINRYKQTSSWSQFLKALELRFESTEFESFHGALSKFIQTETIVGYQAQLNILCRRGFGTLESILPSCFNSGSEIQIRRDDRAFQPTVLMQTISLAKLQEKNFLNSFLKSSNQKLQSFRSTNYHFTSLSKSIVSTISSVNSNLKSTISLNSITSSVFKPSNSIPTVSLKRMSASEILDKREKNCYKFDEKFRRGHKCRPKFLLLMAAEDEDESKRVEGLTDSVQQALSGVLMPQILCLLNHITNTSVTILVDSSSINNLVLNVVWSKSLHQSNFKLTPFDMVYGQRKILIPANGRNQETKTTMDIELKSRNGIFQLSKVSLSIVQQWFKTSTDQKRVDKEYVVAELVGVKLQYSTQGSIAQKEKKTHKSSKEYFEHFWIVKRVGTMAYELTSLKSFNIRYIFYISKLKKVYNLTVLAKELFNISVVQGCIIIQFYLEGYQISASLMERISFIMEVASWKYYSISSWTYPAFNLEDELESSSAGEIVMSQGNTIEATLIKKTTKQRDNASRILY